MAGPCGDNPYGVVRRLINRFERPVLKRAIEGRGKGIFGTKPQNLRVFQ